MKDNWQSSLEEILHHEGGYVNHPRDPGGETNLGVTKRVYEEWGGEKDMRDLCVFDFGVNAGPGRAAKYLQRMIGTTVDGGIGPNTLKSVEYYVEENGLEQTIEKYQEERQLYYESLPTFDTFGRGWTRRVQETTASAKKLI